MKHNQKRYPELNSLRGILSQFQISNDALAKKIGRSYAYVNRAINGHVIFDLDDCKKIQKIINTYSRKVMKESGEWIYYTLDDIFFAPSASKTKQTA